MINEISFECERCGACCDTYSFKMTNRDPDNDPTEIARLIAYHGCKVIRWPNEGENGKDAMGIQIPITCDHLGWDEEGKSFCKIYETRPIVCKEYFCKKIVDKQVVKLSIESIK